MNNSSVTRRGSSLYALAAGLSFALAGCADLNLGPDPSHDIGPGEQSRSKEPAPNLPDALAAQPATEPATQPASMPVPVLPGTPLNLDLRNAILTAIEHNSNLRVQRLNVPLRRTAEESARAAFDPDLTAQISAGRSESGGTKSSSTVSGAGSNTFTETLNGQVGATQFLPTGTTLGLSANSDYTRTQYYSDSPSQITTSGQLSLTQSLLRGGDYHANLASLRQAQLDTKVTQYELRAFAETLVASIESTYWDFALAQRQIQIYQQSLQLAQDQLDQTNEFIHVGRLAENERAAAEAEVALRREDLINARATLEQTRLKLLQLLNPGPAGRAMWNRPITLQDQPFVPPVLLAPVEAHLEVALDLRPDLNEAKLQIQRGQLEVVRTKNGLLPQLDLFVTLGKTGYAGSFGPSLAHTADGPSYDALVGLKLDYSPLNRAAQASYTAARLTREQALESLDNLTQLAELDVRSAYIDVLRLREQISATAATSKAQQAALAAETEKFRVGRSTSLLVAQAQRDLVQAQINEVQAVTDYLKSLVTLYQQEGSLLLRRGIQAPGRDPAKIAAK